MYLVLCVYFIKYYIIYFVLFLQVPNHYLYTCIMFYIMLKQHNNFYTTLYYNFAHIAIKTTHSVFHQLSLSKHNTAKTTKLLLHYFGIECTLYMLLLHYYLYNVDYIDKTIQ